jgi:hypothetical protein
MESIRNFQKEPTPLAFPQYEADLAKFEKAERSQLEASKDFTSDYKTQESTINSNNKYSRNPNIKNVSYSLNFKE